MNNDSPSTTRRDFLKTSGLLAAASTLGPTLYAAESPAPGKDMLGVGVIGAGGRGSFHLQQLKALKDQGEPLEIIAVCDVYKPRLEKAATQYGARAYSSHQALLADKNVDVVCIATCDHLHGRQAIDAIQAGKDVYCEKPVTHWSQFELTRQLLDVVNASDRVFQLGTQGMADSAWHQMKQLVKEGLIGQPLYGETGYFRTGDWGERGMPVDDPDARPGDNLDWEAFLGDAPRKPFSIDRFFRWRLFMDYAGGPVTDLYPHSLTQVIDILGVGMPDCVAGIGAIQRYPYELREVPDTFSLIAHYPEEVSIAVMGTQGNDYQTTAPRGAGGRSPVIRGWDGTLTIDPGNKEIVFTPIQVKGAKPFQRFAIERPEYMHEYWKHFLACCRTRTRKTWSPMDLAFRTQTVLQMAMLGWQSGKIARYDKAKREILI